MHSMKSPKRESVRLWCGELEPIPYARSSRKFRLRALKPTCNFDLLLTLNGINPGVNDLDVHLLNPIGKAIPWHVDHNVAQRFELSATSSSKSNDRHAFGFGFLCRF